MTATTQGTEGGAAGRRRYLTILFADLSGSTALGSAMEAEHYADLLAALRRLCHEIVPRHGGRIARLQGDGMLALFGYPQAREDDGRRATEAALDLRAAVAALSVEGLAASAGPLALHCGIHGGLVFLSDGDFERGRFDVVGDVPNTAARLCDLAAGGEICVSEETLGPEAQYFAVTPRRLASLKGRALPLAVYRVLGRAEGQGRLQVRSADGPAPFVGREAPLRLLRERLAAAVAAAPQDAAQCVVVSGGPGLGKTRLIEEVVRDAAAARCLALRGYCESQLSAEPLQPFLLMLRAFCGIAPGMATAQAVAAGEQALRAVPGVDEALRGELLQALSLSASDAAARRPTAAESIAALCGLFRALARQRPLMLVVDDLHWADDASLQLLDAIRALRGAVLVLLAARDLPADALALGPAPTLVELSPLGLGEAEQAIEHLLPGADPFIVAQIHRRAGGNPLFMEELCHSAAAEGDRRPPEERRGSAAWLNVLIESRLARLPAAQAEVVRAAAVIGNVFPAWLLERITGCGEHDPLVRALAGQDFLFPSPQQAGTLRFKHGIARDAVYDAVGLHQRRAVHLAVATALAERYGQSVPDDLHEALAYHYAGAGVPAEAARYAELAGDKALAALALDRARAQYAAALAALDRLAPLPREGRLRWCAVAAKLGMACVFDPLGLADGVALFERGVELARQSGDAQALARAEYWLGYIHYAKGHAREAAAHCEAAAELASQVGDERLAAQVRATLGQVLTSACEYGRALVLLDDAIDSKRRQSRPGSSVAVGSAYTLACKGCLLGDRGLFAQADECFDEALRLLGGSPHQVASSVRGWIAAVHMWQGRWDEALAVAEESAAIAERGRSRQLLAMSRALAGYSRWVLTRQPQALQAVRNATAWIEVRNGAFLTSLNYGWLVDGAVDLGLAHEARRHAARLFMRARQRDRIGEAMGCRALARAAARAGEPGRAAHYLELALRSAEARGSPHERAATRLCEALIAVERGRPADARAPLDAACAAFEAMDMRWHLRQAMELGRRL